MTAAQSEQTRMAPATYSNKQVGVHITKVKCTPDGKGVRQFLLYCTVTSGKNAGKALYVPMRADEAEATFKFWTDLTTMPTRQEYVFDVDDRPIATVVYRNNQPSYASNVQADYVHRAKVIQDMMVAAGLGNEYNTAENRELIRNFDTTAQAKQWAVKYIEEKKNPMAEHDQPTYDIDELDAALGRSVITRDTKSRKEYFARVNAIMERYGYDPALYDETSKAALGVESHDHYTGESIDAAVRTVLLYCMDKKPDSEATRQDMLALLVNNGYEQKDFKAATGYANRTDAMQNGKTASELYQTIENWIAGKKQKSNEKATSSDDKQSQPSTTTNQPNRNENERSSEAKRLNHNTSENVDKRSEIRERYNKPQRGNDYLVVQGRVLLLRLDHPDWTIETEHTLLTEQTAVYKATIRNAEGRVIATGHGRATEAGTKNLGGRYVEKAETAAIGRALAIAGFGTDDSLDDEDYIADSPVGKAG